MAVASCHMDIVSRLPKVRRGAENRWGAFAAGSRTVLRKLVFDKPYSRL